jgi:hypothetical protein
MYDVHQLPLSKLLTGAARCSQIGATNEQFESSQFAPTMTCPGLQDPGPK